MAKKTDRQTSGWVKGLKWKWSKETVISEGYILLGSSSDDYSDDERDLSGFALISMQYLSVKVDTVQI